MEDNMNNSGSTQVAKKKVIKIKPVAELKIIGRDKLKLGAFGDPAIAQLFVKDLLSKATNEDYVEFMKDYVESQKGMDDFREKLASCDEHIQ